MVARPESAGHAEACGQVVALGRQVPLVLGDLAGAGLGGLAERLQLGVALGGLLLGGRLELGVGGVLQGLALGVTAQRALTRSADVADRVGAGELTGPGRTGAIALAAGCWWPTVMAPAPAMARAATPAMVGSGRARTSESGCAWVSPRVGDRFRARQPGSHQRQGAACCDGPLGAEPRAILSFLGHGGRPATITARSRPGKFRVSLLWINDEVAGGEGTVRGASLCSPSPRPSYPITCSHVAHRGGQAGTRRP